MKDYYATNSHYLTCTFLCRRVGRIYFLNLRVKGLTHKNLAVCSKIMDAMRTAYAKSGIHSQNISNYTRGKRSRKAHELLTCCHKRTSVRALRCWKLRRWVGGFWRTRTTSGPEADEEKEKNVNRRALEYPGQRTRELEYWIDSCPGCWVVVGEPNVQPNWSSDSTVARKGHVDIFDHHFITREPHVRY